MLLSSQKYGTPTDVWSVGCILGELISGRPLFQGDSTLNQLQKIIQFTGAPSKETIDSLNSQIAENVINQINVRHLQIQRYFSQINDPHMLKLVFQMLQFNPRKRITVDQALSLPLFSKFYRAYDLIECTKIILPEIDDNVRLGVAKYRQQIYKNIQRYYPNTLIITPSKHLKRSQSLDVRTKQTPSSAHPRQQRSVGKSPKSKLDSKDVKGASKSSSFKSLTSKQTSKQSKAELIHFQNHNHQQINNSSLKKVSTKAKMLSKIKSKRII